MYAWENDENNAKHKKAKKSGLVVFHPNDLASPEFADHSMTPETVSILKDTLGFERLLPTQAQAFNGITKSRDVILHALTGSGKTLAYLLPTVEKHLLELAAGTKRSRGGPFMLILVFGNELATQTRDVINTIYGSRVRVEIAGLKQEESQSIDALKQCDILIGTPIKLNEVINPLARPTKKALESDAKPTFVPMHNITTVVIDEVDITLGPKVSRQGKLVKNMLKVIRKANNSLSDNLQTDFRSHHYILCGATIPDWVLKAGFLGVKKYYYRLVEAGRAKLPDRISCFSVEAANEDARKEQFLRVIEELKDKRIIVFANKREVGDLCTWVQSVVGEAKVAVLSSRRTEEERIQGIHDFNAKKMDFLICTDSSARGLDFQFVDTVVMYSLPAHRMVGELFVHRAGRTARVDKFGSVVLLHTPADKDTVAALSSAAHIEFKLFPFKSNEGNRAIMTLKVRNSFAPSQSSAQVVGPLSTLKASLGDAFSTMVDDVKEDGTTVQFSVDQNDTHVVKKKLWKYDVSVVGYTAADATTSERPQSQQKRRRKQ